METRRKILTVLFVLLTGTFYGQGLFESSTAANGKMNIPVISFNGYGRGSFYGGSKSFDYQSVFAEFGFQGKLSLNHAFLFADLRARGGLQFDSLYTALQLKETYVGYQSDHFDVYLGEKIITWGRTDGFNPTNNITPFNYFFLTADPDDQKLPNFLLQAKWHITPQMDIEVIGIPFYRPSIYRYDLFNMGQYTRFTTPSFPTATFDNMSMAAKMNFELPAIGFSVSYFRGYDPFYGFNLKSLSWNFIIPDIELTAETYLKNTAGFDFAVPAGSWIFRGEAAYNYTTNYKDNMYIPNPGLSYVAGVEHDFWGAHAILQYIGAYTFDFQELPEPQKPGTENGVTMRDYMTQLIMNELTQFNRRIFYQQEKFNHALSFSVNGSFAHDAVRAEVMGYYNITSDEWFVRPQVTWNITDRLQTTLGGFYSAGPDKSIYSYSSDVLNGAFVQLKVSF